MRREHFPHTRCYYTAAPDPTKPRNFTQEMNQTLAGYQQTAPGYLAIEQQYQPQYGALGLQNQALSLYGTTDPTTGAHTPGTLELGAQGNTYTRGSNIADALNYGRASTTAQLQANPYLTSSLNNLQSRQQDSPLLAALNQGAQSALASGGQLSQDDIRNLQQQTRSGFADRGNLMGNQALGAELLSRDAAVRQRMGAAQQFAGNVQGLNQQQNDFVGRSAQIAGTTIASPFQTLFGQGNAAGGGGYPQQIGTGAQLFNPQSPYAGDIYSSNQNAQAAHNTQVANASNQNTSNYVAIASALLSDERIKKDIKDTGAKTPDGIPIKSFRYKTDKKKRKFVGVMAGDVEKKRPDAVIKDPVSGLRAVRYGLIAAPFRELLMERRAA